MSIYINTRKQEWRQWAWKQLRERASVSSQLATVLYLAGPSPEDWKVATRNGFCIHNLVAVDKSHEAITAARNAGLIGIVGCLSDAMMKFREDVHGCLADYCGGMSAERFAETRSLVTMTDGGVVMNFQRGRESSFATRKMRDALNALGMHELHRGSQWLLCNAMQHWHVGEFGTDIWESNDIDADVYGDVEMAASTQEIADTLEQLNASLKPAMYSYTANSVTMDSIAVSNRTHRNATKDRVQHTDSMESLINAIRKKKGKRPIQSIKGKQLALKAVRTSKRR